MMLVALIVALLRALTDDTRRPRWQPYSGTVSISYRTLFQRITGPCSPCLSNEPPRWAPGNLVGSVLESAIMQP